MRYVIDKEVFAGYFRSKEAKRDETMKWPNSFGHGFNSGQVECLMELRDLFVKEESEP